MAYEKQQWDTTSYINPTRMNHIEDGIKSNSNEIESIANNVIAYGECTTARSTSAKVVSCSGFVLKKGSRIAIRFTDTGNSNPSSGNLTLNVNGTGAKTIVDGHANKTILTYANGSYFYNNLVAEFVYDGTYWVYMNRDANTTYTGATLKTGAAKTGSGTTVTDTIAQSTTIDNAIQTLLNNDVAINSNLVNTNNKITTLSSNVTNKIQMGYLSVNLSPSALGTLYTYQHDVLKNASVVQLHFESAGNLSITLINTTGTWDRWVSDTTSNINSLSQGDGNNNYWTSVIKGYFCRYTGQVQFEVCWKGSSQTFANLKLTGIDYIIFN